MGRQAGPSIDSHVPDPGWLRCPPSHVRGPGVPTSRTNQLGLSMISCIPTESRGVQSRHVEDHDSGLADHLPGGCSGLENERTEPVSSPTLDRCPDHGPRLF